VELADTGLSLSANELHRLITLSKLTKTVGVINGWKVEMDKDIYTTINIKLQTKERLEKHKITAGEYWDDLINRLLDEREKTEASA